MRIFSLSLVFVALIVSSAVGAPGDQWILGIHHLDNQGDKPFTTYAGAGYSGSQSSGHSQYVGNAYGYASTGAVGVNRVWWELSGSSMNNGTPVPTTAELYSIEFFGTTDAGHNNWQPVESHFHGIVGEGNDGNPPNISIDIHIPWQGQFGTNHQWIGGQGKDNGLWNPMNNDGGGGPQAPTGPAFNAPGNGIYMWLTRGSWLYAKWDFGFPVNRSWSALRLTQVTPLPGPPVDGDYNGNGTVDAADYVVWRDTYGDVGEDMPADGFPDGFIDEYDYDFWRETFGNSNDGSGTGTSTLTAVPEPATLMLIVVGAACIVAPRRRRHLACALSPTLP